METRKAIGAILMFTGAILIVAHLAVIGGLVRSGVYLDESGEDGESAVASHLAMPMGAGAFGIGIVLILSGLGRKRSGEDAVGAGNIPAWRKGAPVAVMLIGLVCVWMHVVMLRSLVLRVEAFESQPGFVASGAVFEAEKARARVELERINAIFYLGMAIAFAGLASSMGGPSRRKSETSE